MERSNLDDNKRRRRGAVLVLAAVVIAALIVVPACSLSVVGLLGPTKAQPVTQHAVQPPHALSDSGEQGPLIVTPPRDMPNSTPEAMPGSAPGTVAEPTPPAIQPWQGAGRLSILVMGIDQRPDDDPDKANTDTMIIMTLDPATRSAGMLSIPRDLYVQLPNRGQDRINTAHAIGGPAYAMRAVESIFGIRLQHYVRVNFTALTRLVDLVDGIDVYVDQDINDPTYPDMKFGYDPFVISKGWHHMDGATALKYARTRHGSNDMYRMRRQQQIIMALRDRILSTDAIPRLLPSAPLLLNTLSDSIATDLSLPEMLQLILFAKDLPADKITRVVVDESAVKQWVTPTGAQVLLPVQSRIRALAAQVMNPTPASAISTTLNTYSKMDALVILGDDYAPQSRAR